MTLNIKTKLSLLISLLPVIANAMVINQDIFIANGGDMDNVAQTIKYANLELRKRSYATPYFTVGKIPGCTATWMGNDGAGWAYILTAAHCVPYSDLETPTNTHFRAWDGTIIAQGEGTIYVHENRINKPVGMGGASTDIAIVKIPVVDTIYDDEGKAVEKPIIYDGSNELNKEVQFVGYGSWGVGIHSNGAYFPIEGDRRLYGESIINGIWELDHGMGAGFKPEGNTKLWARLAQGDSGSAWWQKHDGIDTIVATTNGKGTYSSTSARVSKYVDWIKRIYPEVELFSNQFL
ncbi:hypothetical protein NB620_21305 [Vibrio alginolyticus]|uniref:trypsin-like serine peptidase n=1 Tax=Vibrio alginolyticus TaxID=663 RepID=UPI00215D250E|nr:hypothetical protein [Vibrio alginolyticus]MCS0002808.1 hypothetical protein [Vibrio alginolyticus]